MKLSRNKIVVKKVDLEGLRLKGGQKVLSRLLLLADFRFLKGIFEKEF